MTDSTKAQAQEATTDEEAVAEPEAAATEEAAPASPFSHLAPEELLPALDKAAEANAQLERDKQALAERVAAAEAEIQRMAADFQNARKRLDRFAQERIDSAALRFAAQMLPMLDDLELALANAPDALQETEAAWLEGLVQIHEKTLKILREEGIEPIDASGAFDPNLHEAVQQIDSAEHEPGHIVDTLRTGYQSRDKVLRPALVRIAQ